MDSQITKALFKRLLAVDKWTLRLLWIVIFLDFPYIRAYISNGKSMTKEKRKMLETLRKRVVLFVGARRVEEFWNTPYERVFGRIA